MGSDQEAKKKNFFCKLFELKIEVEFFFLSLNQNLKLNRRPGKEWRGLYACETCSHLRPMVKCSIYEALSFF